MIIINLKGGLGNQMFQYACGRALSLRNGDGVLKLNIFGLDKANEIGDIYRPYSLSNFDIQADIATMEELERVANPLGIVSKLIRYVKAKFIYNFYIHFVPSVLTKKGDLYLDGFFQSEAYFKDHEAAIRRDFRPKSLSDTALGWTRETGDVESVSLHVRRGDYVGHKTLGNIATKEYYERAISRMRELVPEPHYFVFSDDVEWVRTNLGLPEHTRYVSSKELKDYEELVIMSSCKHNVIANSSFSWWGAWLNNNPGKNVIAPSIWAHGRSGIKQTRDIIPKNWVRITSGIETSTAQVSA